MKHRDKSHNLLMPRFKKDYYEGRYGLPNTVREKLLQTGRGEASLVLDMAYRIGFREGDEFTAAKLIQRVWKAGIRASPYLLRRALHDSVFGHRKAENVGRGRPTIIYKLPSIEYLVTHVAAGEWGFADTIAKEDMHSLSDYRAGLHREFIARAPGQYPRAFLAERLGVTRKTTANYDKKWSITVSAAYDDVALGFSDLETLPPSRTKERSRWLIAFRDGDAARALPYIQSLAAKLLYQGYTVIARTQQANVYRWERRYIWGSEC